MNNLHLKSFASGVIAVGITFGPLFMTNVGGVAVLDTRWWGAVLLAGALLVISITLHRQHREIEHLRTLVEQGGESSPDQVCDEARAHARQRMSCAA